MNELLDSLIERELQEYQEKYPQLHLINYLNNFDGHLPGGYRTIENSTSERERLLKEDILSKKSYENEEHASLRRRSQTGLEFQAECKSAILEAGIDRKSTRLNSSHSDRSRMPSSA